MTVVLALAGYKVTVTETVVRHDVTVAVVPSELVTVVVTVRYSIAVPVCWELREGGGVADPCTVVTVSVLPTVIVVVEVVLLGLEVVSRAYPPKATATTATTIPPIIAPSLIGMRLPQQAPLMDCGRFFRRENFG